MRPELPSNRKQFVSVDFACLARVYFRVKKIAKKKSQSVTEPNFTQPADPIHQVSAVLTLGNQSPILGGVEFPIPIGSRREL